MRTDTPHVSRLHSAWLVLAIWTVPALIGTAGRLVDWRLDGSPGGSAGFWGAVLLGACPWYTWAALTPLVLRIARRHPITSPVSPGVLLWHAATSVVVAHLYMSVGFTISVTMYDASPGRAYLQFVPIILPLGLLGYWAMVVLANWLDASRRLTERTVQAARTETQLAQARLDALAAQVNPHFLFNTLNSVSALVRRRENERATSMIARLGDLLRRSLSADRQRDIPLAEELDLVRGYLAIEQERLGDRLDASVESGPGLEEARVPNLLLQPLVENAVLHGVAPVEERCGLAVRARREGAFLVLTVENEGALFAAHARGAAELASLPPGGMLSVSRPRRAPDDAPRHGVGLVNVRERLAQWTGGSGRLAVDTPPAGGCTVTLYVPWSTCAEGVSA